ncbi:MAG: hypothetical protein ACOX3V_04480 [Bacillota bacterium]|jgi:hypothetical protein
MGPRYMTIASFVQQGPTLVSIHLGAGLQASFLVETVSPPWSTPEDPPSSQFSLSGPEGEVTLTEDQITQIQPDGPQEGTKIFISLDSGASLVLSHLQTSRRDSR